MASINYQKLVGLVKKGANQSKAAADLGITVGQLSMLVFSQAQVDAGLFTKAPATGPSVKKLRDSEGNRWELIAARTGISVAQVKAKYEEAGGNASASFTGRGRKPNGGASKPAAKAGAKGRQAAKPAAKPAAKKPAGKPVGRAAAAKKPVQKARTLAERRAARAANPS